MGAKPCEKALLSGENPKAAGIFMADKRKAWILDQIAKSELFHQKLHEWGLIRIATILEEIHGEQLDWNLQELDISQSAWNKLIHRGIKPIRVFAHPEVLSAVPQSTSYYRMLSMVSQKSMSAIGLNINAYEQTQKTPTKVIALKIAQTLNHIISLLVDADEFIEPREFDIWRGMAAGTQAQGAWQNVKGKLAETVIKGMLRHRLETKLLPKNMDLLNSEINTLELIDDRRIVFADEPDIGIYQAELVQAAVEIKGGIDGAGVLERVGAAMKSLYRAKDENSEAITILIVQAVSLTTQAKRDLANNRTIVNHWFTVEDILENEETRDLFFQLLNL
jgi:hypothetical protein